MKNLKKLKEELDLSKKPELRINKNIFRGALVIILILFVAAAITDGSSVILQGSFYMECPASSETPCDNPFYTPEAVACDQDIYCVEMLQPGEILGEKPSFLTRNFFPIAGLIVLGAFLVNFLFFKQKKGIPVRLEYEAQHPDFPKWRERR